MDKKQTELEEAVLSRKWFYRFRLPDGRVTECYIDDDVVGIHETRERMLHQALDAQLGADKSPFTCLDLGAHEGYYSQSLARAGFREVLGLDARLEHVENATLMARACGVENVRFSQRDLQNTRPGELGEFDVCLLFGLLYHVENPIGVLRLARAATRKVCVIETQVAPNITGVTDWGSHRFNKRIVGCWAMVDETVELTSENKEAAITPVSLFPSLEGLLWSLKAVGFADAFVLSPPKDAYEQLASGKRVVVVATATRKD